jgi:hypothetical protein
MTVQVAWLAAVPLVLTQTTQPRPEPAPQVPFASRAAALPACTIVGTPCDDTLVGPNGDDRHLCGDDEVGRLKVKPGRAARSWINRVAE